MRLNWHILKTCSFCIDKVFLFFKTECYALTFASEIWHVLKCNASYSFGTQVVRSQEKNISNRVLSM